MLLLVKAGDKEVSKSLQRHQVSFKLHLLQKTAPYIQWQFLIKKKKKRKSALLILLFGQLKPADTLNDEAHFLQEMRDSWKIYQISVTIWHQETISRQGRFQTPLTRKTGSQQAYQNMPIETAFGCQR